HPRRRFRTRRLYTRTGRQDRPPQRSRRQQRTPAGAAAEQPSVQDQPRRTALGARARTDAETPHVPRDAQAPQRTVPSRWHNEAYLPPPLPALPRNLLPRDRPDDRSASESVLRLGTELRPTRHLCT